LFGTTNGDGNDHVKPAEYVAVLCWVGVQCVRFLCMEVA